MPWQFCPRHALTASTYLAQETLAPCRVVEYGEMRAITAEEHRRIVEREGNRERRAFYELLWHTGGSQGDITHVTATDIDWTERVITYRHQKTEAICLMYFVDSRGDFKSITKTDLARVRAPDRATEFKQRCQGLGISGVTLHS